MSLPAHGSLKEVVQNVNNKVNVGKDSVENSFPQAPNEATDVLRQQQSNINNNTHLFKVQMVKNNCESGEAKILNSKNSENESNDVGNCKIRKRTPCPWQIYPPPRPFKKARYAWQIKNYEHTVSRMRRAVALQQSQQQQLRQVQQHQQSLPQPSYQSHHHHHQQQQTLMSCTTSGTYGNSPFCDVPDDCEGTRECPVSTPYSGMYSNNFHSDYACNNFYNPLLRWSKLAASSVDSPVSRMIQNIFFSGSDPPPNIHPLLMLSLAEGNAAAFSENINCDDMSGGNLPAEAISGAFIPHQLQPILHNSNLSSPCMQSPPTSDYDSSSDDTSLGDDPMPEPQVLPAHMSASYHQQQQMLQYQMGCREDCQQCKSEGLQHNVAEEAGIEASLPSRKIMQHHDFENAEANHMLQNTMMNIPLDMANRHFLNFHFQNFCERMQASGGLSPFASHHQRFPDGVAQISEYVGPVEDSDCSIPEMSLRKSFHSESEEVASPCVSAVSISGSMSGVTPAEPQCGSDVLVSKDVTSASLEGLALNTSNLTFGAHILTNNRSVNEQKKFSCRTGTVDTKVTVVSEETPASDFKEAPPLIDKVGTVPIDTKNPNSFDKGKKLVSEKEPSVSVAKDALEEVDKMPAPVAQVIVQAQFDKTPVSIALESLEQVDKKQVPFIKEALVPVNNSSATAVQEVHANVNQSSLALIEKEALVQVCKKEKAPFGKYSSESVERVLSAHINGKALPSVVKDQLRACKEEQEVIAAADTTMPRMTENLQPTLTDGINHLTTAAAKNKSRAVAEENHSSNVLAKNGKFEKDEATAALAGNRHTVAQEWQQSRIAAKKHSEVDCDKTFGTLAGVNTPLSSGAVGFSRFLSPSALRGQPASAAHLKPSCIVNDPIEKHSDVKDIPSIVTADCGRQKLEKKHEHSESCISEPVTELLPFIEETTKKNVTYFELSSVLVNGFPTTAGRPADTGKQEICVDGKTNAEQNKKTLSGLSQECADNRTVALNESVCTGDIDSNDSSSSYLSCHNRDALSGKACIRICQSSQHSSGDNSESSAVDHKIGNNAVLARVPASCKCLSCVNGCDSCTRNLMQHSEPVGSLNSSLTVVTCSCVIADEGGTANSSYSTVDSELTTSCSQEWLEQEGEVDSGIKAHVCGRKHPDEAAADPEIRCHMCCRPAKRGFIADNSDDPLQEAQRQLHPSKRIKSDSDFAQEQNLEITTAEYRDDEPSSVTTSVTTEAAAAVVTATNSSAAVSPSPPPQSSYEGDATTVVQHICDNNNDKYFLDQAFHIAIKQGLGYQKA